MTGPGILDITGRFYIDTFIARNLLICVENVLAVIRLCQMIILLRIS